MAKSNKPCVYTISERRYDFDGRQYNNIEEPIASFIAFDLFDVIESCKNLAIDIHHPDIRILRIEV